ncbi:MAG: flagellar hook capping protein [Desulfobulbus propionicus]|nr:MAG: flagellar hook capping protein [Desulfobulbus propionicus]PIE65840.1 MAG: flagellar hook capping protein [Desulfobacterales bacterium]
MATVAEIAQQKTAAAAQAAADLSGNTLGQQDFLTLLVAQMQNQDPLNPADPTEFTSQLAQYSELEQLFNLNDAMKEVALAQNNSQRITALSLMGKEILVEGNSFESNGAPMELGYRINGTVVDASLEIRDSTGKTVAELDVDSYASGNHSLTWDGKGSDGSDLEPGTYTIIAHAVKGENDTSSYIIPLVRSEVTGVNLEGTAPLIVTDIGEYKVDTIYGAFDQEPKATTAPSETGT